MHVNYYDLNPILINLDYQIIVLIFEYSIHDYPVMIMNVMMLNHLNIMVHHVNYYALNLISPKINKSQTEKRFFMDLQVI
jgi:hypothetical protein